MARVSLARGEARLDALRLFLAHGRHDDVVAEAQEAVEILLRGALRLVAIEPSRRLDPAPVLLAHLDRFPPAWHASAEEIRITSGRLVRLRDLALYGDEDRLVPPSELFGPADAAEAIAAVERLLALYRDLLGHGGE
jgi:HEPN domain-containing protein